MYVKHFDLCLAHLNQLWVLAIMTNINYCLHLLAGPAAKPAEQQILPDYIENCWPSDSWCSKTVAGTSH